MRWIWIKRCFLGLLIVSLVPMGFTVLGRTIHVTWNLETYHAELACCNGLLFAALSHYDGEQLPAAVQSTQASYTDSTGSTGNTGNTGSQRIWLNCGPLLISSKTWDPSIPALVHFSCSSDQNYTACTCPWLLIPLLLTGGYWWSRRRERNSTVNASHESAQDCSHDDG